MSEDPANPTSQPELSFATQIDTVCDRFEAAWKAGGRPQIEEYLQGRWATEDGLPPRRLLLELIHVDLAYRWARCGPDAAAGSKSTLHAGETASRSAPFPDRPLLEDYLRRFPSLGKAEELPPELLAAEYRARRLAGENPGFEQYVERFGGADTVSFVFDQVDRQLARSPADRPAPAHAPRRLGKFELLELLGQGGFGAVYRARDTQLGRIVAIKMPRFAELDEGQRERFFREARAAAGLRHPQICPVYEAGEHEGQIYIALGFIDGLNLRLWAEQHHPSMRDAAALVAKIAQAVDYAHRHGVIHRDIKPANVMIDAEHGAPVLMDFGLAKEIARQSAQLTRTGDVMGTPAYMSPEQAAGRIDQVGAASDIYSLGAVLYELVAGRPPFQGPAGEVLVKVQVEEPPSLRSLVPQAHRDLETICLKAMHKDPAARYPTAMALADDLRRFVDGEAILARREGSLRRSLRRVRRRPVQTAIACGALLAVIAGALLSHHGVEARRVSEGLAAIEAGLEASQSTASDLERLESLVEDLGRLRPDQAAEARKRVYGRFAAAIGAQIARPRLEPDDIDRIRSSVTMLKARDPVAAARLETWLAERVAHWDELFTLSPPFKNVAKVWGDARVHADPDRLTLLAEGPGVTRLLTRVPSHGHVELDAEFDASWHRSATVGLLLGATQTSGYVFRLRSEAATEAPAGAAGRFGSEPERQGGERILELMRDSVSLRKEHLRPAQIPAGGLRLRARREGNLLTLWLGDEAPLVFEDPFPLSTAQPGVLGLAFTGDVGLLRLVASRQAAPPAASPLERGDELYGEGHFAQALAQYQQVAAGTREPECRAEAQYKTAMSLVALKREQEAEQILLAVASQPGARWPGSAGVQLWALKIAQGDTAAADSVFESLSGRYSFAQLATLVPVDLRRQIMRSYVSVGTAAEAMVRAGPDFLRDAQRMRAVAALLGDTEQWRYAAQMLALAYGIDGDMQHALQATRELYERIGWNQEYSRLLRITGGAALALQLVDRELANENALISGRPGHLVELLAERGRIRAALEQWERAEADIEQALQIDLPSGLERVKYHASLYLMLGFVRQHRGASQPEQIWQAALTPLRLQMRRYPDAMGCTLDFVVMATLAGQLTEADVALLFPEPGRPGGSQNLLRIVNAMIDGRSMTTLLDKMWHSPQGRKWAEVRAFRAAASGDRQRPGQMFFYQFICEGAFAGNPSAQQDDLLRETSEVLFKNFLGRGALKQPQLLQLALAWKGVTNLLGWQGLAPSMDPPLRAQMAYILAHRHLTLGNRDSAADLLRTAAHDAAPGSPLARLAEGDLRLLNAGQIPAQVPAARGSAGVEPGRREAAPARPRLPLGPGAVLSGLVSRPASLAGAARWQVDTVAPRGVAGLSWSPDSRRLACACGGQIRIYDPDQLRLLQVVVGNTGPVLAIAWSPDGRRIAAGDGGLVRSFQADSGRPGSILSAGAGPVKCLAWSPDGTRLALAALDEPVHIGSAIGDATIDLPGTRSGVQHLAWAPDGVRLACATAKGLEIWNTLSAQREGDLAGSENVGLVGWSRDGRWLLTAAAASTRTGKPSIGLWNAAAGKLEREFGEMSCRAVGLAWSPDGLRFAVADERGRLSICRLDGALASTAEQLGAPPIALAWSPDGKRIASGSRDGVLCLWNADGRLQVRQGFPGGKLKCLAWGPDCDTLIAGSQEGTLHAWNLRDGSHRAAAGNAGDSVEALACLPGRAEIALAVGPSIQVRSVPEGRIVATLNGQSKTILLAPSPGGAELASAGADRKVSVWSLAERRVTHVFGAQAEIASLAWSPDGKRMAVGEHPRRLEIWEPQTGATRRISESESRAVGFSPDNRWLACAGASNMPGRLLGTRDWTSQGILGIYGSRNYGCLAWSPDSRWLALGAADGATELCNLRTRQEWTLARGLGMVEAIAFSPDGKRLAAAGQDQVLRVWDPAGKDELLAAVVLPGMKSVSLRGDGALLGTPSAEVDRQLVYILEEEDRSTKLLAPADFRRRFPAFGR